MPFAFAAAKVNSLVVEDDKTDQFQIERKLRAADVFSPAIYDNYRQGFAMEHARAADIVALDVEVERVRQNSIDVANKLKRLNPDQTVIFFTSSPHEVMTQPINFVLDKSEQVWDAYERILMHILIHDKSLALLKSVNDFCMRPERWRLDEIYSETRESICSFVPPLLSIKSYFQRDDKETARRYEKLLRLLTGVYAGNPGASSVARALRGMRQPLLSVVLEELGELTQVEGVHVTPKLYQEVERLRDLIMTDEAVSSSGLFFDRAKVYALEGAAGVLDIVNQFLQSVMPAPPNADPYGRRWELEAERKAEVPEEALEGLSAEALEGVPAEAVEDDGLYLNAWFPEYEEGDSLKVGVAAKLRINIAPDEQEGGLGASDPIPPDKARLFYTIDHVDVMVICPEADVRPLLKRLELPPSAEKFVEFEVTARGAGAVNLTVALLVCNEPIYRTVFSCSAVEAEASAAVAGTTAESASASAEEVY